MVRIGADFLSGRGKRILTAKTRRARRWEGWSLESLGAPGTSLARVRGEMKKVRTMERGFGGWCGLARIFCRGGGRGSHREDAKGAKMGVWSLESLGAPGTSLARVGEGKLRIRNYELGIGEEAGGWREIVKERTMERGFGGWWGRGSHHEVHEGHEDERGK